MKRWNKYQNNDAEYTEIRTPTENPGRQLLHAISNINSRT